MDNWNWNIENEAFLQKTIARCKEKNILLPTFAQLRNPQEIPASIQNKLKEINLNDVHPLNLFRINWRNDAVTGGIGDINYVELPSELTGVKAKIIGLCGKFFPTGAHKVGASFGCLVPNLVTGKFNPEYHKAVWPSTGNYCRGGVFNSALLGVHGVAILPEEMSKERFDWLYAMGAEVFATYGCESNVKEIYDKCHELGAESEQYYIFNQFEQFGNTAWHYEVTGHTFEDIYKLLGNDNLRVRGYVSATGSAGTIGAGDYLKKVFPTMKIVASEALQCPTLLMNGYGAHRIEGIGDKHIPWIHNTKNTDYVAAINDEHPLRLLRTFNEPEGQEYLKKLGVSDAVLAKLPYMGISSISNMLSAVKFAKYNELNENDVVFTVFTDSVEMYRSRLAELTQELGNYSATAAEVDYSVCLANQNYDNLKELTYPEKKAIHNLKYFTWVEQQGKDVAELNAQWYSEEYWEEKFRTVAHWDSLIEQFNAATGVTI
ncbi:MAG: pyridoxal-phosphate dependent enzyme [Ignavibacteria bacterium]|nr:pyridoxal-phosphate dependent enzyme [Ignavibacteria bacterium]